MAIAVKRGADGDLELIQVGDSIEADSLERRDSAGDLVVGSLLGATEELKLGSITALTHSLGDAQVDGQLLVAHADDDTVHLLALDQSGSNPGASRVFVGNRDPEGAITANAGDYYMRDGGDFSQLYVKRGADATNTGWTKVMVGENDLTTGVIAAGSGNITNGTLASEFTVAGGTGQVIDNSIPDKPTGNPPFSWTAFVDVTPTLIATTQATFLAVDFNAGSPILVQQTNEFSDAQHKSLVVLGAVGHFDNATITDIENKPDVGYGGVTSFKDFRRTLEPFIRSGGVITGNANLTFQNTAGTAYDAGANFQVDPNNPDIVPFGSNNPVTFARTFSDGTPGGDVNIETESTTLIDPLQFENGGTGVLSAMSAAAGGARAQVQRLYVGGLGPQVGYGQVEYNSLNDAITNAQTEMAVAVEAGIMEDSILLGAWCVRQGATDLSNTNDALFVPIGTGGGGGGGGGGGTAFSLIADSISGDQNNYAPTGWAAATHLVLTATGANRIITGFLAPGGSDSFEKTIVNVATYAVTVPHEDALSLAANRVLLPGKSDYSIGPNESLRMFYDTVDTRWRLQ